jgi:hypothetical protein
VEWWKLSIRDEGVSFSLEVNVEPAYENVRRLETAYYRSLSLARRMGLPDNVDFAIAKIQQYIAMMNKLRLTMIALETASGPVGWALALIGAASLMMDVADFGTESHSR